MFKKFRATYCYQTIYDIPVSELKTKGITHFFTDLDNTLVADGAVASNPELRAWINQLNGEGIQLVIISNNKSEQRVADFANPLALTYYYRSGKPKPEIFHKVMKDLGITDKQVIMIGDRLTTDVYGANRADIQSVLVAPIDPKEPFGIRCMRIIENIIAKFTKEESA